MSGNEGISAGNDIVWGAAAIAKVINRTPRQTYGLLETGALPAKKIGGQWAASKQKLLSFFAEAA
ncbi:DNA-binding protein [Aquamicrobium segne]|uniref:DNA-binding protein n=1 Tax=Aquamicrobium segne TaxID=469547 RepID=A0ABW0GST8_9HYPH